MKAKTVVVGVTGSIAAYKACELVRLFVKSGADVHVIMTESAREFVTPLTFRTLSRNPVESAMFEDPLTWKPEHISLADAADLLVVAPCTANVMAKMACGLADDLLSSVALATKAPILVAPAMNTGMWTNPATQANYAILKKRGVQFVDMTSGELACGTTGVGRMADPETIFKAASNLKR